MLDFNKKKWLILAVLAALLMAYVGLVDDTFRDEIRVFLRQLMRAL
ncbi:hypothetical protein MKW37_001963 [Salmonella enterica subsp. enterica]|nr:hypothetical protein [Salmonella enterica]EDQ9967759.1 hypothetical protein [Salmonella enterica subsp. enterica serovar Java]EDX4916267.1 hypothetical protein [Salmonella enterica subsp. enterica]EED6909780.1 hypothetical protein [Salmonella enterica subsp. enterica serovar Lerum]EDR2980295.1 hypothetical protein [Salmonella enterica subsp. enterica serovar Java]EGG4119337.1 hypothetical protein [Salmonella enterica]